MKLHRLELRDFRGVRAATLEPAATGVTVVSGPNEIGKSSLLEALEILLTTRSNSAKRQVKDVKPIGRDVGTRIAAEVSIGPYRFELTKKFNRGHLTELTIIEPTRQQLTGRSADQWVEETLDTYCDTQLMAALRVLQSAPGEQPELAGSAVLSRALDLAAGSAGDADGHTPLLDRVRAEYERYYTPAVAAPTGDYAAAIAEVAAAQARFEQASADLAEVEADSDALDDVTAELAATRRHRDEVAVDAISAERELRRSEQHRSEVALVAAQIATVNSDYQLRNTDLQARQRLSGRRTALRREVEQLGVDAADAARLTEEWHDRTATARTALTAAEGEQTHARERLRAVLRWQARAAATERAQRLTAEVRLIDAAEERLSHAAAACQEVAIAHAVAAAVEETVERRAAAVAVRDAAAPQVSVHRTGKRRVLFDGVAVVTAEQRPVADNAVVEVPGIVRVEITGASDAAARQRDVDRCDSELAELFSGLGVGSLAEFRERQAKAVAAQGELDRAHAELTALLAGRERSVVQAQAQAAATDVHGDGSDPGESVEAAQQACDTAAARIDTAAAEVARATTEASVLSGRADLLQERLRLRDSELARITDELAAARADCDDTLLDSELDELRRQRVQLQQRHSELAGVWDAARHEEAELRLENLRQLREGLETQMHDLDMRCAGLRARLSVFAEEGRHDSCADAEQDLARAQRALDSIRQRAEAARLLHTTMHRHRDAARARYVRPFAERISALSRPVFGDDAEVSVGADLQIISRTVDGVTVPYEALSGGAKEQLAMLSRLACAELIAPDDQVPVFVDDALGYSDPRRQAAANLVLHRVGQRAQVIVLTCDKDRYSRVGGARHLQL